MLQAGSRSIRGGGQALIPRGWLRRALSDRRLVRAGGAVILLGGWILLFNRTPDLANPPLSSWKKEDEYDTAWLCEEARRKKAVELAEEQAPGPGQSSTVLGPLLRYRCERSERVRAAAARRSS